MVLVLWIAESHRSQLLEDAQGDALALALAVSAEYRQYIDRAHQLLTLLSHLPIIRSKNMDACNTLLAGLLEEYSVYNGIFVVDADTGIGLCSARPYVQPVDNGQFAWYQEVLAKRDFVISEYRIGPQTGDPILTMGLPVYDDAGQLTAVVATSLSLRWLNEFVQDNVLPPNSSLTITDAQGTVLVRYPERTELVGQPFPVVAVRNAMLANPQGMVRAPGIDAAPRIFAYTRIDSGSGSIYAIAGIPEAVIFADAERVRVQSLIVLAVMIVIGVAGAWLSGTVLVRPIHDLNRAIRGITSGQPDFRAALKADTVELQGLLAAFNEMAATIEQRMNNQIRRLSAANAERDELFQAERQTRQEVEKLAENLAQLQAVTEMLGQAVSVNEVTRITIEQAINVLGAKTGSFHLYDEAEQMFELRYTTSSQPKEALAKWQRYPADPAFPITSVVRQKRALWCASAQDLEQQYPAMAEFSDRNPGASAILPVVVGERALGAVGLTFAEPRTFSDDEKALALSIVHQCAQALDRVRLAEQAEAAAAVRERQRLARDLHDAVSQTLYSATIIAESIPRLWQSNPQRALALLEQVHTLNRAAGAEMRVLLWELRPEALEKATLQELLTQLALTAMGRKEVQVSLDLQLDPQERLPAPVHVTFYRIAQEALNNVIKHAQAQQVIVSVKASTEDIVLCIEDDGKGFDAEAEAAGMGLGNMRERADSIGASLAVTSTVGKGTRVVVRWLRQSDPDAAGTA
ncbi:MAG: GAF domain-containing protein [Chloroflexi bacterium]|nr:GAF domain-containing protein [Chloroflexota bacterium]